MLKIIHRVNTIEKLNKVSNNYGVEVDIRSYDNKLILHHDPFEKGEDFNNWLKFYNHRFLILNVKEEGLENYVLEKMKIFKIKKFFFLDQSIPFLIKTAKEGENRCAIRLSEYENILNAYMFKNLVKWIWVDCFSKLPININQFEKLKNLKFKLCLVSPELQGRGNVKEISKYRKRIINSNMKFDAVCTKYPILWS